MTLHDYLALHGLSPKAFSEKLKALFPKVNASERAVIKWSRGERTPRPDAMKAIAAATNGAVSANDFFRGEEAA